MINSAKVMTEVVIARTRSITCPISMLQRYMCMAKIPANSELFLFHPIVAGQTPTVCGSGKLSHSRLSELIKEKLAKLDFSPHNLSSGGATVAAEAGVPDCIFRRHGQWKSENAKDGYILKGLP